MQTEPSQARLPVRTQRLYRAYRIFGQRPASTGEAERTESRVLAEPEDNVDLGLAALTAPGRHPAIGNGWRARTRPPRAVVALNMPIAAMPSRTRPAQADSARTVEEDADLGRVRGEAPGVPVELLRGSAQLLSNPVQHRGVV